VPVRIHWTDMTADSCTANQLEHKPWHLEYRVSIYIYKALCVYVCMYTLAYNSGTGRAIASRFLE